MKRKTITFFIMHLFCILSVFSQKIWDGSYDITWYTSNTSADEYEISTAEELAGLAFLVNSGNNFYKKTVHLKNDVIFNEKVLTQSGLLNKENISNFKRWTPIGNINISFTGNIDCHGHTISGIYIDESSTSTRIGFIGSLGREGSVRNLTIIDSYIKGGGMVACICGENNKGTIENCKNYGTIAGYASQGYGSSSIGGICGNNSEGIIKSCSNFGIVDGYYYTAGICGYNYGGIENCENHGAITCNFDSHYAGGICGYSAHSVLKLKNNINYGPIIGYEHVGGICGENSSITEFCNNQCSVKGYNCVGGIFGTNTNIYTTDCYNNADISGDSNIGGIFGWSETSFSDCIIDRCYNTGTINGNSKVGGVCGHSEKYIFNNCYNTGNITGTNEVGGICGKNELGVFEYCYNVGHINCDDIYTGSICGWNFSGTINNCYWLDNTANSGIGNYYGTSISKTFEEFASGEVCWLLNKEKAQGPWGQNITNAPKDPYPILGGLNIYKDNDGHYYNYEEASIKNNYSTNNCFNINTTRNGVIIKTKQARDIYIYNINGYLLWHKTINGTEFINLPNNHIYIINGNKITL